MEKIFIALLLGNRASHWPHLRIKVFNRVAAKFVDLFLVVMIGVLLPYPLGPMAGFLYSLFADGMSWGPFESQSVGKKLFKLRVVSTRTGLSVHLRDSALRNAPVGVATFFAIIPVWGWLILILVGLPLMIMEIYLMLTVEAGHRLGDVMGGTEVVEIKHDSKERPESSGKSSS